MLGFIAVTGCDDTTIVLELNSDGSGRVVESVYVPAYTIKEWEAMGIDFNLNKQRVDAAIIKTEEMGEDVFFDSITKLKKPDGSQGAQTVYRFKDITKLKLYLPTGLRNSHVTFAYANGQLSVSMPEPKERAQRLNPRGTEFRDKRIKVITHKQQLQSLRMRILLKMPSAIRETNAMYLGSPTNRNDKSIITLVDLNLEEMLNDIRGRAKFISYYLEPETYISTLKVLDGTPGVKYETNTVINISVVLAPSAATIAASNLNEQKAKDAKIAFSAFFKSMATGDFQTFVSLISQDMIEKHPEIIDKKLFLEDSEGFRTEIRSNRVQRVFVKGDIATITATFYGTRYGNYTDSCKFKLIDGKWKFFGNEDESVVESDDTYLASSSVEKNANCYSSTSAENAIHRFMIALYSNDNSEYTKMTLPCPDGDTLLGADKLTEEEINKAKSDVASMRLSQSDPYRLLGKEVKPDKNGRYPIGTKATFMTQSRGVQLVVPVSNTDDGWKVDVRYWIAMQKEYKETDPEIVAKKFLFFLIGHKKKELAKVSSAKSNFSNLLKGEPAFEDQYYALAMEMSVVQALKDEAMLLPDGKILKAKESTEDHKWFVGMYGPYPLLFELVKEKGAWKTVPKDYLSIIGIREHQ